MKCNNSLTSTHADKPFRPKCNIGGIARAQLTWEVTQEKK